MTENSIWIKAKNVELQVAEGIEPGFDAGFDSKIPQDVYDELCSFMDWIWDHYPMPVTLWVDFEYRHYLIRRDKKHVGYLFYWADFSTYPVFSDPEKIPTIRLAVRTEHWTIKEILMSFADAIAWYLAWLCNEDMDTYQIDTDDSDEIVEMYFSTREDA